MKRNLRQRLIQAFVIVAIIGLVLSSLAGGILTLL
jgi:hypothetical protein